MTESAFVLRHNRRKHLKVGILELIERKPTKSLYSRLTNPNYASVMPTVVAVWVEQLGHDVQFHTFTGLEDPLRELPTAIDILFVCAYTQSAYLAYSISNIFRQKRIVTVLGGPHARVFPEDAARYFDYVVGLTDKALIHDLLADFQPNLTRGMILSAARHPSELPGLRERWKYIKISLDKTRFVHSFQMIASFGCPYQCNFCLDAGISYKHLPFEQIGEDLRFLQNMSGKIAIFWADPNFGVRFDRLMDTIEKNVSFHSLFFGAETSLSLLSEDHLKRLRDNNFIAMMPGVESWSAFGKKSMNPKSTGMQKVLETADHFNLIAQYIPFVQANFLFGLDTDQGIAPFQLTKTFIDLAPAIYPNYAVLTMFGSTAEINREYQAANRVLDIPFPFLDCHSTLNVRLNNYTFTEFYEHMIDLARHSFSPRMLKTRFKANWNRTVRWFNLIRALSSEKSSHKNFTGMRDLLTHDPEFRAFYEGDAIKPPSYFHRIIKADLGPFYETLPERVVEYLNHGEPGPNPRISNMIVDFNGM